MLLTALPAVASAASIQKTGHRPQSATVQISGVGSGAFDAARFSSWHFEVDQRFPLIHAKPGGHCPDTQGNISGLQNFGAENGF